MSRKMPAMTTIAALIITPIIAASAAILPAQAAACGTSIAPSAQAGSQAVNDAYQQWKDTYVTANGANGQLRVQRSADDNYDTVSEGIAYGMLFAAYASDRSTFDKLWAYEQMHRDPNGLMNWKIDGGGNTSGWNAATDADEDMAIGLVMADKTWGGYTAAATDQIQKIERTEIEPGSYALKPGDVWGGSGQMNPSYLSPSYYPVFKVYTNNGIWDNVATASANTFSAIRQNTPARTTGLIPDWSTANGYQTNGMSYGYSYDASRAPIRLALASAWTCDNATGAALVPFNDFFQKTSPSKISTGYNLDGTPQNNGGSNLPYVAAAAAGAMTSPDTSYRTSLWSNLVNAPKSGYFADSMRMLGLLTASGMFTNPVAPKVTTPVVSTTTPPLTPTPAPTATPIPTTPSSMSKIDIWWPINGSEVTGTQPFKVLLQDHDVTTYTMYWQVDGGQLNTMSNNYEDYQHKQADVNVAGWNWRGAGPYTLTFVAKDGAGKTIGTANSAITIK